MRKFLVLSVLALTSLLVASAKTYDITISSPTKVGSVQLKAGQYKLKVDGSNAVFTDQNNDKSYTTPLTSPGQSVVRTETYQYSTAGTAKARCCSWPCTTSSPTSRRWR